MNPTASLSRLRFLQLAGAAALAPRLAASPDRYPPLGLCVNNAGGMGLLDALAACARIGYDNAALFLGSGHSTDPLALSRPERKALPGRLRGLGLSVTDVVTSNMVLGVPAAGHRRNLESIKVAAEFAHEVAAGEAPPLEGVINGTPEKWEGQKRQLADQLGDWGRAAAAQGARMIVKAHANHVVDTPEKLLWLLQQVNDPAVGADYDYSHFECAGYSLEGSLKMLLPYTHYIEVKDARTEGGKLRYLLPGEGDIDYAAYFRLLRSLNYTGPVVVEISQNVVARPHYDFLACAKQSFAVVSSGRQRM